MSLLSIVLPAYNEEQNIANTAKVLSEMLEENQIDYELIFISDGSKDGTFEEIKKVSAANSRIKGAQFSRNFGKESAVLEIGPGIGALTCQLCERYDKVVAVEIDRTLIPILAETLEEYDNIKVVNEDFMKLDLKSFIKENYGDTPVSVNWEDNEAVQALKELCQNQTLTIQMSMYGGFEQVGSIGTDLPQNNVQTTTSSGDIVLYSGNQMVVFYGSNTWAYTQLGHITDKTPQEMTELLSDGNVTITISF